MSGAGFVGSRQPASGATEFDAISFIVQQLINQMWTITLVEVKAVHGGGVNQPPTVDVLPLVNQVDGRGQPTPHGTVYGIQCARIKFGTSAIICDPEVGDIGVMACSSHDTSSVIANQGQANPGSYRRFSASDGVYLASVLGATPTTYIQLAANGDVNISASGNTVKVIAQEVIVQSDNVNLGDIGGQPVARIGDTVVGGVITSGSAKVKSA